jgi:3D (Asp-Asp-Asp) domain-containing protein
MICLLAFILSFTTMSKTELIAENAVQIETYQTEVANELAAEEEEPEVPMVHLWGVATITHYCNCSICCGQWAGGGTASGTTPTAGRTVAADLPFGTRLLINGQEYIVEDRGVSGCWVDIYCDSHAEALARGMYQTEVYIIDG